MNRKIRSISITENIDTKIVKDSQDRGLTVSANISRILFDYFDKPKIIKTNANHNIISKVNK